MVLNTNFAFMRENFHVMGWPLHKSFLSGTQGNVVIEQQFSNWEQVNFFDENSSCKKQPPQGKIIMTEIYQESS